MKIELFKSLCKLWAPDFEIEIVKDYPKDFMYSNTPIRVMSHSKFIQIKKKTIANSSRCELLMIIRWCTYRHFFGESVNSYWDTYFISDELCMLDCIDSGFGKQTILKSFLKYIKIKPSELNLQRIQEFKSNLINY